MDQWKLWLFHLFPLCLCSDPEVTFVTTTDREPYVAPLCTVETMRKKTIVLCRVSRETEGTDNCFVMHPLGKNEPFSICDSRFSIRTVNQTAFLHLSGLTRGDSGNYTCRCPFPSRDVLKFHITVKEEPRVLIITTTVIGCAFLIVTGVVLGWVLRKKHCRDETRSGGARGTSPSLDQDDPDDTYTSLQQPAGDLYQTISSLHRHHHHDNKRNPASNAIEADHVDDQGQSRDIYEND